MTLWVAPSRPQRRAAQLGLLLAWVLPAVSPGAHALNYAEGGDSTDDPAAADAVPPAARRYVDAVTGRDANDGTSPQNAWQTLAPVNENAAAFPPGTYILFKRGDTFAGTLRIETCQGGPGRRIVFGAYGPGHSDGDGDPFNDLRPRLVGPDTSNGPRNAPTVALGAARWVTIRDLDTGKMAGSPGDTVIFNNVIHGNGHSSNVLRLGNHATRCALVQNLVYDCAANDLITLHSGPATPPAAVGPSHWIVDNVVVGNTGAESGIDLQVGAEYAEAPDRSKLRAPARPETGLTRSHMPNSDDFKIIGNRVQMQSGAIPGLAQRHPGRGTAGIEGGHLGRHIWIMGNMVTGASRVALKHGGLKQYVQMSGNLLWRNGAASNSIEVSTDDTLFEHNTVIHVAPRQSVLSLKNQVTQMGFRYDALRWTVRRNLLIRTSEGNFFDGWSPGAEAITAMDWNWYGGPADGTLNGLTLARWQSETGHDRHSAGGAVPGVSLPSNEGAAANPKRWYDPAFLAHFTPAAEWQGHARDGVPAGAISSNGRWQGGGPWGARQWEPRAMRPFTTLAINGGYGWEGPPLIQQRYPLPAGHAP